MARRGRRPSPLWPVAVRPGEDSRQARPPLGGAAQQEQGLLAEQVGHAGKAAPGRTAAVLVHREPALHRVALLRAQLEEVADGAGMDVWASRARGGPTSWSSACGRPSPAASAPSSGRNWERTRARGCRSAASAAAPRAGAPPPAACGTAPRSRTRRPGSARGRCPRRRASPAGRAPPRGSQPPCPARSRARRSRGCGTGGRSGRRRHCRYRARGCRD